MHYICQPGFLDFVIFSKKEKIIILFFVNWSMFFRILRGAREKNNGNSPHSVVY